MNKKVYLVESFFDGIEKVHSLIGIYDNKKQAIEAAEEEWNEEGNWHGKLEIPYKLYTDNINHFFECCDDECEWDSIFFDYLNYSKEQWERTYEIADGKECTSYYCTTVYEFILNKKSFVPVIWQKYDSVKIADALQRLDDFISNKSPFVSPDYYNERSFMRKQLGDNEGAAKDMEIYRQLLQKTE